MEFSDKTAYTSGSIAPSPNGKYVAHAQDYMLVVRDIQSLAVLALFSCSAPVEEVAWAPDSDHCLAACYAGAMVHVFSLSDADWSCTIGEGAAGCVAARWDPAGRHIILTADFGVRVSVWSLEDRSRRSLPGPKHPREGLCFSPDGTQLAVLHRSACKDSVAVYSTADWTARVRWQLDSQDAADLAWSPDGDALAVWEAATTGHGLWVYDGNGGLLAMHGGPGPGLGIKSVAWSPSGQLLAVGDWEGTLRLLSVLTQRPLAELMHPSAPAQRPGLACFREVEDVAAFHEPAAQENRNDLGNAGAVAAEDKRCPTDDDHPSSHPPARSRFALEIGPLDLQPPRALGGGPRGAATPSAGVGPLAWSEDGEYISSRSDALPHVAWVWSTARLELAAVLVFLRPVRALAWQPGVQHLVALSSQGRMYCWTPAGASCVHLPHPDFKPQTLAWTAPERKEPVLLLPGRDAFVCCYM